MKITKEKQFSRIRTFNLPEMLQVICDDSAIYVTKRVDIGNVRDTILKQSNSKYLGKESKITKEQIVDLGDDTLEKHVSLEHQRTLHVKEPSIITLHGVEL